MDDSYTNYVKDMERGSQMLLAAINAARAGTCPATPLQPVRLPPDYTKHAAIAKELSEKSHFRNLGKRVPSYDRARIMLREGYTIRDIAAALKCSHQKATAMVKAIKEQKPADDDLRGKLWG
jgi:hypothetical protein